MKSNQLMLYRGLMAVVKNVRTILRYCVDRLPVFLALQQIVPICTYHWALNG